MALKTVDTQVENSKFVNRFAYIRTKNRTGNDGSIFYRARIVKETNDTFTVTYVSKTDPETHEPRFEMEIIKKIDIVEFRLFVN